MIIAKNAKEMDAHPGYGWVAVEDEDGNVVYLGVEITDRERNFSILGEENLSGEADDLGLIGYFMRPTAMKPKGVTLADETFLLSQHAPEPGNSKFCVFVREWAKTIIDVRADLEDIEQHYMKKGKGAGAWMLLNRGEGRDRVTTLHEDADFVHVQMTPDMLKGKFYSAKYLSPEARKHGFTCLMAAPIASNVSLPSDHWLLNNELCGDMFNNFAIYFFRRAPGRMVVTILLAQEKPGVPGKFLNLNGARMQSILPLLDTEEPLQSEADLVRGMDPKFFDGRETHWKTADVFKTSNGVAVYVQFTNTNKPKRN